MMKESIILSSIEGNRQLLDGGAMFGNVPKELWKKWLPSDEKNRIPLACRALLAQIGSVNILCETGIGAFFEPSLAERYGVQNPKTHILLENLKNIGLNEEDIDFVILSHLHFDHAGGLLSVYDPDKKPRLLFPKACYVVGDVALERAQKPHLRDRASFIPSLVPLLKESKRLLVVKKDKKPEKLPEELFFHLSYGHTPGQLHVGFKKHKDLVFFAGDLIPGIPWLHLPLTMGYDRYPEKVIDEKQSLYKRACKDSWYLFYTHDSQYALSQISKNEKGKYIPIHQRENFMNWKLGS